jgi:glycerophosphoryl diester phosphodiesterase
MMARVWNVAHRGASADRPENTLSAFELAVEQDADVIEADVRRTADGALLVLHDPTVDRTTSGTGPLSALSEAEARALDAGEGARIPTVAEVLEVARGRVRVNLDLKEVEVVEPAVRLVHETGMLDSVTFISFLPEAWDLLERLTPESPIIHLVDSAAALAGLGMADGALSMAAGVGVPYHLVGEDLTERLHRHGYGVFAWTVDDDSEMRRLMAAGVNGIVTNRPALLAEVIRQFRMSRPGGRRGPVAEAGAGA